MSPGAPTFVFSTRLPHKRVLAVTLTLAALGFGGCAQSPQQFASATPHGKEYFPSSIYGRASRRVVADGQPVPRGGGQYLVGRPYTVAGQTYYPSERHTVQIGRASWYGDAFHGRLTANGEIFDRGSFTAAHPTMPLPSYARVTNLANNYSMIVRVNDRGPYASNRIMDVSGKVAEALDFKRSGTADVKVEYVGRASLAGSDDAKLYATLRQDGPAQLQPEPTMVAAMTPRARVASIAPYAPFEGEVRHRLEATVETGRPGHGRTLERDAATLASLRDEQRVHGAESRKHATHPGHAADTRAVQFALAELKPAHLPPMRTTRANAETSLLPPSRPIDLGTIPGAASQIGRRHPVGLRMARARDDD